MTAVQNVKDRERYVIIVQLTFSIKNVASAGIRLWQYCYFSSHAFTKNILIRMCMLKYYLIQAPWQREKQERNENVHVVSGIVSFLTRLTGE